MGHTFVDFKIAIVDLISYQWMAVLRGIISF